MKKMQRSGSLANFFKSTTFNLTDTNLTTVLSIGTSVIAIVKSVQAVHDTASNVDTDLYIKKSSGSNVQVAHAQLNKSTVNLVENVINLEGGDALKMQADAANEITGQISYLLIDRSQENG